MKTPLTSEVSPTPIHLGEIAQSVGLVINAPEIFARKDFMNWLCRSTGVFTWHDKNMAVAGECSDVVVLVDANYEGDGTCMPQDIWETICNAAYAAYGGKTIPHARGSHVTVRLTNLVQ